MSTYKYDIPLPRRKPDGSIDERELESWMRSVHKKFSAVGNFVNAVVTAGSGITLTFDSTANTLTIATTIEMPAAAALGDMIYADGASSWQRLTGNTSATKKYLSLTGDGTNSGTPSWETIEATSLGSMTSAEFADVITDETGTGKVVFNQSPLLITPNIGNAVCATLNKVFFTTPATSCTITVADGKTLTCNNTITISGTDSEALVLTKGLTVTTNAGTIAFTGESKTLNVEDTATVNQDLTTDAQPTFAQLAGLGVPDANGEAIRQTAKITEANLEDAVDKKHAVGDSIAASISDGDTTHSPDGNSVFDALALKLDITSLVLPFYDSDGNLDTIPLTAEQKLPFYNAAGASKDIALTT